MDTAPLFFILFFSALVSAKEPCTPSCGDVNISYPFHLKGDPSYCGNSDPNYELTCNSRNQTFLNLFSLDYKVNQISYHSDVCRVDVTDVTMPVNDTCRLPTHSLPASKLKTSPYYGYHSYECIVNCTKEVNNNCMYSPVPCLSRNNTFIYIVPDYSVRCLVSSCSFLATGPTGYFDDLCKFELTARKFSLGSVGCRPINKKSFHLTARMFGKCLESSWKMFFDDIRRTYWWPYHLTVIRERLPQIVLGIELNFLTCLSNNRTSIKNFNLFFGFSIAAVVLIQIVKLLIVLQVLGRTLWNHAMATGPGFESLVDQTISVITNDGRNIVGILKGFDQATNIILDESHERVYSTKDIFLLVLFS
ncbi:hypothetical protein J5N97_007479 [Dioscorea zingiberensis]|uniref:RING-type E3 ubiquitin transferase n=1 Tax=Dioscorea zingiberensis TaxID=325984 RepID=A0A9D5DDI7_9LILI|nr:hypothetical protein J5N97_007479 [Dioscorea zingiberensis]